MQAMDSFQIPLTIPILKIINPSDSWVSHLSNLIFWGISIVLFSVVFWVI